MRVIVDNYEEKRWILKGKMGISQHALKAPKCCIKINNMLRFRTAYTVKGVLCLYREWNWGVSVFITEGDYLQLSEEA